MTDSSTSKEGVATRLGRFIAETPTPVPNSAARIVAAAALVDTLACVLAGQDAGPARIVEAMTRTGTGSVSALGGPANLDACSAAMLDATRGHVLDFDDVSYAGIQHGSVIIVPAALAVARERGREGPDLIDAVAIGSEVAYALGRAMGNSVYDTGWWATGVLSGIGAAAACARLGGLDATRAGHAVGLAALEASGFRRFFGTASKSYMAGRVAANGVMAARAAASGIDTLPDVFEGPNGFLALFRPGGAISLDAIKSIGHEWTLVSTGVAVKPWPICSCGSAIVEAVSSLRADMDFVGEDVVAIDARVTGMVTDALGFDRPTHPLQLLFSLPYAAALAARHGTMSPTHLTDATLTDPALADLAGRVTYRIDDTIGHPTRAPEACAVDIVLRDGRRGTRAVDVPLGDPSRPLSSAMFQEKLRACAVGMSDPTAVVSALQNIDRPDGLARLFSLCAEAPSREG